MRFTPQFPVSWITLKMEAASANVHHTQEYWNPHEHRCEDPTSNIIISLEKADFKCSLRKCLTSLLKK